MMAVGVKAAVGAMLAGQPFLFVQVRGMTFGAAQDCQGHANAEGVQPGNCAACEKVIAAKVAQELGAEFFDASREEVLPVGKEAASLVWPLFGWVCWRRDWRLGRGPCPGWWQLPRAGCLAGSDVSF